MSTPQPSWGTTTPAPHSHRKYIIAILLIGIIAFGVGFYIAYNLPVAPDVDYLSGTVSLSAQHQGTASVILFYNITAGNLSSIVFTNQSYEIWLPIGYNYAVTMQWVNLTSTSPAFGMHVCTATPSSFTAANPSDTQNFTC